MFSLTSVSTENLLTARNRARAPICRLSDGSLSNPATFAAIDAGSYGSHNIPETSSSTNSGPGPVLPVTTALLIAMPSMMTMPWASILRRVNAHARACQRFGQAAVINEVGEFDVRL